MFKVVCNRCGAVVKGRIELTLENEWDDHVCKGMRELDSLDLDLLRELVTGKIKEDEAWATHDFRRIGKRGGVI